jgi:CRP-like cAMP-binding protein
VLHVDQSTKVIHEGMKDRDIYLVLDGEVFIETAVGRRAVARRGDVVGEFALFLPQHRRSKSAYARRARILVIKQNALESLKTRSPRRYIALIEALAQRVIAKLADWEYESDEPLPRPLREADG